MCGGGLGKDLFDAAAVVGGGGLGAEFLPELIGGLGVPGLATEAGADTALGAGVGSGIGSAAGGLATGEKPLQALETGGISGLTAGIGNELLSSTTPATVGANATGGAVPTAPSSGGAGVGGAVSGGPAAPSGVNVPSPDDVLNQYFSSNNPSGPGYTGNATGTGDTNLENIVNQSAPSAIPGTFPSFINQNPSVLTPGAIPSSNTTPSAAPSITSPSAAPQSLNAPGTGGLPANPTLAGNVLGNENAAMVTGSPETGLTLGQPDTFSGFAGGPGGANIPGAVDNFGGAFTPSPTSTPTSGSNFLSHPSLSNFGSMLLANPMAVASAGGIGVDALENSKLAKGQRQLNNEAGQLAGNSTQLEGYLQNGTLPPGVQASINQAAQSQKAAIMSRYAAQGGSGSSAEQQDLAAVDAWAQGEGASTAMSLLNSGISEAGLSSQLYQSIANTSLAEDKDLGTAIGNFASSLGGGGNTVTKGTFTFG